MRFAHKLSPKHGTKRIKKFFAFFPVTINDETRWLEFVKVKQIFIVDDTYLPEYKDIVFYRVGWNNIKFLD